MYLLNDFREQRACSWRSDLTYVVSRRKGKQTSKEVGNKPANKVPWNTEQERLLTECFIDVLEDPRRGTSQSGPHFWGRIQEKFNARTDVQRTRDQLSSK